MCQSDKSIVVGLTGGIGAGKSTITSYLRANDIPVFDCDAHVAMLYSDPEFLAMLEEEFGDLGEDPKATMARKVVADPPLLDRLQVLFGQAMLDGIEYFKRENNYWPVVAIDAPVLFEHGLDRFCDYTITVNCPEEIRRERVMSRPGMTVEKLNLILSKQLTDSQRESRATFAIDNTGTPEEARIAIKNLILKIKGNTIVPSFG